jgi:Ca2+-transporting ATPase
MLPKKYESQLWYQMCVKEVLDTLETHEKNGLSSSVAEKRLEQIGHNALKEGKRATMIDRIVSELKNPLTFILLCAGIVTTLLGEYVDSTVIFIALIINIAISLYQEGRADNAFLRLRNSQEKFATIIRDGKKERVDAEMITMGDIVFLEAGMNIPADLRIIEANNLEVNESPLSGEWIDVMKQTLAHESVIPFTEQRNMGFMGTFISGGSGLGVVVEVGNQTKIGSIASSLGEQISEKTPLQKNIADVARFLSYIVLCALVGIFVLGLVRGMAFTELLLISIAIAVAAIPEGLPAAVTVVLAIGMEAILKRGGLVRNLLAAETLGSTTVIMTDKTGTLTRAEMVVAKVLTLGGVLAEGGRVAEHKEHEIHGDERDVLQFATLCADAFIEDQGEGADPHGKRIVRGRPVERAVVLAALESGLDQTDLLQNYPRLDFFPFESKYRVALSLHHIRGLKHQRLYVTGAPEYILAHAGAVYMEGRAHIVSDDKKEKLERVLHHYTSQGFRVIGVAYRDTSIDRFASNDAEMRTKLTEGLILAGFIVLHDPLRSDVPASIREAKHAGARVIMATGDNPETARTIAEECGIWKEGDKVMKGIDTEHLSDAELLHALRGTTVFARMLPEHKLRLARVLTASGEIVAMTGDGVNDAPALRAANIGVALGSGTEVAKEASDLILLDNSFSIIVDAIEEGRRIIDNLRKIVAYLLSTSFTEIIAVGGALAAGIPIPLLPAQILWTNMLSEGFMNFAFAFEPKEDDLMMRDPKQAGAQNMLSRTFMTFVIAVGLAGGLVLLAFYAYLLKTGVPTDEARTLAFILLTLGTTTIAFALKDLRMPIFKIAFWSNRYLLGSFVFSVAGLAFALEVDFLSKLLRLVDVDYMRYAPLLIGAIILDLIAVEIAKYFLFPRRTHGVIR